MQEAKIAIDPAITDKDNKVDRGEMRQLHTPPRDMDGEGVSIVVQDTGLDVDHQWIKEQTSEISFKDFSGAGKGDGYGHGTMVSDLATRYAKNASLEMHRVFGGSGSGGLDPFTQSFEYILDNADQYDVLVMSWGTPKTKVNRIDNYVNRISKAGVIPVSAAGNSGGETGSPATAKRCISVGALGVEGEEMTNFSSWDQDSSANPGFPGVPEVSAVGKNVVGARASGTSMGRAIDEVKTVASGTSFSNPLVANVVVDLVRRTDVYTTKQILKVLEASANDIPGTTRDGLGRVNWKRAVASVGGGKEENIKDATVWSLPFMPDDFINIGADVLEDGEYEVSVEDLKEIFKKK